MSRIVILTVLFCILLAAVAAGEKPDVISHIKLLPMTKEQFLDMRQWGLDIKRTKGEDFEVFANPGDLQKLSRAGINYEVIQPDLQEFYELRSTAADFGGFRTLLEIEAHMDYLAATYPSILTPKYSIGTSIEGRDLWMLKLSDNPEVDEDEPEVFYVALIHAREPAASAALVYFMEYMRPDSF